MPLETFLELAEDRDLSLVVVNRDSPTPIQSHLESLFETQSVSVQEEHIPDGNRDLVSLLDDSTVIASSPLSALQDAILRENPTYTPRAPVVRKRLIHLTSSPT